MSALARPRARLTRDGLAFGVFLLALLGVAWASGNNLVTLVAATLVVCGGCGAWLARRNLMGLEVRRLLPEEVFVGRPARLGYTLRAPDGWLRFELAVDDVDGRAGPARCAVLPAGETVVVHRTRTFARRGRLVLGALRVRSAFPFRLAEVSVALPVSDELWVFPEPRAGAALSDGAGPGGTGTVGDPEDVRDLRPYRPGDRLRDVHPPTSARLGTPMVVVRDVARSGPLWVEVREAPDVDREEAISRATGAVLDAALAGRPVGLRADGRTWPPRGGAAWRRELLTVLASLPGAPR